MPDTAHAKLRDQLADERARLLEQLRGMGRAPEGSEQGLSDPDADSERLSYDEGFADSGQVTAERGEVDALAGSLLENLNEIEEALAKFDLGSYGRCERCDEPIPAARLEAMPSARLCIACASTRR